MYFLIDFLYIIYISIYIYFSLKQYSKNINRRAVLLDNYIKFIRTNRILYVNNF